MCVLLPVLPDPVCEGPCEPCTQHREFPAGKCPNTGAAFTPIIRQPKWPTGTRNTKQHQALRFRSSLFPGHRASSLRVISGPTIVPGPRSHNLWEALPACPRPQEQGSPPAESYGTGTRSPARGTSEPIGYLPWWVLLFASTSHPAGNKEQHALSRGT